MLHLKLHDHKGLHLNRWLKEELLEALAVGRQLAFGALGGKGIEEAIQQLAHHGPRLWPVDTEAIDENVEVVLEQAEVDDAPHGDLLLLSDKGALERAEELVARLRERRHVDLDRAEIADGATLHGAGGLVHTHEDVLRMCFKRDAVRDDRWQEAVDHEAGVATRILVSWKTPLGCQRVTYSVSQFIFLVSSVRPNKDTAQHSSSPGGISAKAPHTMGVSF